MYLVQHVSFVAYVSTHNFNQEGNNGGKDTLYCTVDTERMYVVRYVAGKVQRAL